MSQQRRQKCFPNSYWFVWKTCTIGTKLQKCCLLPQCKKHTFWRNHPEKVICFAQRSISVIWDPQPATKDVWKSHSHGLQENILSKMALGTLQKPINAPWWNTHPVQCGLQWPPCWSRMRPRTIPPGGSREGRSAAGSTQCVSAGGTSQTGHCAALRSHKKPKQQWERLRPLWQPFWSTFCTIWAQVSSRYVDLQQEVPSVSLQVELHRQCTVQPYNHTIPKQQYEWHAWTRRQQGEDLHTTKRVCVSRKNLTLHSHLQSHTLLSKYWRKIDLQCSDQVDNNPSFKCFVSDWFHLFGVTWTWSSMCKFRMNLCCPFLFWIFCGLTKLTGDVDLCGWVALQLKLGEL